MNSLHCVLFPLPIRIIQKLSLVVGYWGKEYMELGFAFVALQWLLQNGVFVLECTAKISWQLNWDQVGAPYCNTRKIASWSDLQLQQFSHLREHVLKISDSASYQPYNSKSWGEGILNRLWKGGISPLLQESWCWLPLLASVLPPKHWSF